jgi:hypothetical protein
MEFDAAADPAPEEVESEPESASEFSDARAIVEQPKNEKAQRRANQANLGKMKKTKSA